MRNFLTFLKKKLEVFKIKPLRITAILQDGRVAGNDPWFPLDSLLAASWFRINHPELIGTPITNFDSIIEPDLPLKKLGQGDGWFWACSFNRSVKLGEYVKYYHKRFDDYLEQYLIEKVKKIDVQRGKYKAGRFPLTVQLFDRFVWYAVGDQQSVQELCNRITHIGKKPSQGFGAVDEWIVEPWPEDWSVFEENGKLSRAVPVGSIEPETKHVIAMYPIRPPYWLFSRQRLCYMPEAKNAHDLVP